MPPIAAEPTIATGPSTDGEFQSAPTWQTKGKQIQQTAKRENVLPIITEPKVGCVSINILHLQSTSIPSPTTNTPQTVFLQYFFHLRSIYYLLLAARIAPVMAPLVIEFHGSSFPRTFTRPQSIIEKSPPHTAKLPATARFYMYEHFRIIHILYNSPITWLPLLF